MESNNFFKCGISYYIDFTFEISKKTSAFDKKKNLGKCSLFFSRKSSNALLILSNILLFYLNCCIYCLRVDSSYQYFACG